MIVSPLKGTPHGAQIKYSQTGEKSTQDGGKDQEKQKIQSQKYPEYKDCPWNKQTKKYNR